MGTSPGSRADSLTISGRYRIVRKLGSGTMGTVYLVRDENAGRLAALKLLRSDRMDAEGLEQLQREFSAIASLHHPQIAAAHDFGYTDERLPYYTREYIEGSPLAPGPPGQSSPHELVAPFLDLLEALHYLHAHEILHLDIHPGNVIVSRDASRGSVLIDFGLLRPIRGPSGQPFLAVRSRLAPEIAADEPLGPATDLYAVGRLLLYRLTGKAEGEARLPGEIPGWGARSTLELERIVGKAIQRNPRQRFQSAAELREALAATLGSPPGSSASLEPGDLTVGRGPELAAIENALRRGAEGGSALIWLEGPEGIGKTRLLSEARQRAQLRGLIVARADFLEEAGRRSPLVTALRAAIGARQAASSWLGVLEHQHGGSTSERARRAADSYFQEEGPPFVVLLDDVESCDRPSRILIKALACECTRRQSQDEAGRGLVIIAASQPGEHSELLPAEMTPGVKRLRPLSAAASRQLLTMLLRPLAVSSAVAARLAREAGGQPRRLRSMARALRNEWKGVRAIPREAEPPRRIPEGIRFPSRALASKNPAHSEVLRALALLGRPSSAGEIAAASGQPAPVVQSALRRARRDEAVLDRRRGGVRRHQLVSTTEAARLRRSYSPAEARRVHRRMVTYLSLPSRSNADHLENLARHLLALGRRRAARKTAFRAADLRRGQGDLEAAISILTQAAAVEMDRRWRWRFAEEMSSIHEHAGDHQEGIVCLEAVLGDGPLPASSREAVRIRRRLGVHHHRAGEGPKALELFREVLALADPERDVEELVFVGSELAELHTLRGEYAEAEQACRQALDLLAKTRPARGEFRCRMEVTLRASLGHLELRRMALRRAREEFQAAAKLAGSFGTTTLQALILNNLGIVHNQLNEHSRARACFRRSERLLERAGEKRGIISIACNLASLAAKTGDAAGALGNVERAARLLARHPARRLELQVILTRGMVLHLLGDEAAAVDALRQAIPLGRSLGDAQFTRFTEVYLGEAELACGQVGEAARRWRRMATESGRAGPPVLHRMACSRLLVAEALLGRTRAAEASRNALTGTARTEVVLLEAWNDLFLALGQWLAPPSAGRAASGPQRTHPAEALLAGTLRTFQRLGIPAGARLAHVGLLETAVLAGDMPRLRSALRRVEEAGPTSHRFLAVLEPLARAEAALALGELEQADEALEAATCAIVGLPFLELDLRIELLGARLADRRGDREGARRHLRRTLQTQELLARTISGRDRQGFLTHPRFSVIRELADRLERPRLTPVAGGKGPSGGDRHGLIGCSLALRRVQETIDRLRDQEIPVLITGETGTGKEIVARAVHAASPRRRGQFFALHCGSLPAELFEAELFGYEAGAFTGAGEPRQGLLEHLAGGTLLLDEVASLAPQLQAKLLRLLDRKMARPLGGVSERPIDVRFVASSSADIQAGIAAGTFRADLYFRLRGVEIVLEPMRARREDIPLLANHFLAHHARRLERPVPILTAPALQLLEKHDWPGNVRELETLLVRVLVTSSPGPALDVDVLRRLLPARRAPSIFSDTAVAGRDLRELKRELERVYLARLFRDTAGDVVKMTQALHVKVSRLYAWLREVGLDIATLRREL